MKTVGSDKDELLKLIDQEGMTIYTLCKAEGYTFNQVENVLIEQRKALPIGTVRKPKKVNAEELRNDVELFNDIAQRLDFSYDTYLKRREQFAYSWYECQDVFRMSVRSFRDIIKVRNREEPTNEVGAWL